VGEVGEDLVDRDLPVEQLTSPPLDERLPGQPQEGDGQLAHGDVTHRVLGLEAHTAVLAGGADVRHPRASADWMPLVEIDDVAGGGTDVAGFVWSRHGVEDTRGAQGLGWDREGRREDAMRDLVARNHVDVSRGSRRHHAQVSGPEHQYEGRERGAAVDPSGLREAAARGHDARPHQGERYIAGSRSEQVLGQALGEGVGVRVPAVRE